MDGTGSVAERDRSADNVASRCNVHLPNPLRSDCHRDRADPSPAMSRLGTVYLSNLWRLEGRRRQKMREI